MMTFLPIADFKQSLEILDYKRLGKQRLESKYLIYAIQEITNPNRDINKKISWENHPITQMWIGYEEALKLYYNLSIDVWIARGYKNTMQKFILKEEIKYPIWFGNEKFHSSHRSVLLNKNYEFYKKYEWEELPENNRIYYDMHQHSFVQYENNQYKKIFI